jgi:hypothetical protein
MSARYQIKPRHTRSPLEGNNRAAGQARRAYAEGTFHDRQRSMYLNFDKVREGARRMEQRIRRGLVQTSRWHHQRSAAQRAEWRHLHAYIAAQSREVYLGRLKRAARAGRMKHR